ncbi:hypothetical protein IC575_019730 [Cucumis melo]
MSPSSILSTPTSTPSSFNPSKLWLLFMKILWSYTSKIDVHLGYASLDFLDIPICLLEMFIESISYFCCGLPQSWKISYLILLLSMTSICHCPSQSLGFDTTLM